MDAVSFYRWNMSLREAFFSDLDDVDSEDLTKEPSGGQSILSSVRVMVETEWLWLHCASRGREITFLDDEDFVDLAHAVKKADEIEEETVEWFRRLAAEDWERTLEHRWEVDGPALRFTREQAVFHVVTHEFHRRGECGLILRALGYEPAYVNMF